MHQQLFTMLAIVVALIAAAGCAAPHPDTAASPVPLPAVTAAASGAANSLANGRSIFMTGKDVRGVRIAARKPPLYPSCAACHRSEGSGGVHLPGGAVSADLRHAALVTRQKRPYTLASLERAIATGSDNMGAPLAPVMPRWQLSQRDLHDVAEYVFTRLK